MALVYSFSHRHRRPPRQLAGLLGGKGANLAEMTSVVKLPVPPGFTITTDACRKYMDSGWPGGLDEDVERHLGKLERQMGKHFGAVDDPLLLSVRSGAKFSMPGMMDTILNLGLNDRTVKSFANSTGDEAFAYRSYARLISMFGKVVLGVDDSAFDQPREQALRDESVEDDSDLSATAWKGLCKAHKAAIRSATRRSFPQDPTVQLHQSIEAVFKSWNGERAIAYREREHIAHDLGTAVNIQAMVFGNRDDESGTGVAFTRDAATGENAPYGDFLVNAQGEDVVAGVRKTEPLAAMGHHFPEIYDELLGYMDRLEAHYRDMLDLEFTIEEGRLWILQVRIGKRSGVAALRMAVEMTKDKAIRLDRKEAVSRITPDHLDQILHPTLASIDLEPLTSGLGASPGAAVGAAVFSANEAIRRSNAGESVILVRRETSPEDVHGMLAAEGVLTSRGGLVSHAAVVARGWGKPAVVGADQVVVEDHSFSVGDLTINEGEVISLDGSSGHVFKGAATLEEPEPTPELEIILSWADAIRRGRIGVRANADNGPDAARARRYGAEGIGLCRTEHMFLDPSRLPIMRRMILAETEAEEAEAFDESGVEPSTRISARSFEEMDRPSGHRSSVGPAVERVSARSGRVEVLSATDGLSPGGGPSSSGGDRMGRGKTRCSGFAGSGSRLSNRVCTLCRSGRCSTQEGP
ncbi:MAG: pyruvate, phosphate dikinase [Microthrixaceae bacterium]